MPTLASMQFPPPTSWQEFERIALSSLSIKWDTTGLVLHGRQGQAQQGVDIYGPDDLGRLVGVQAKCTDKLEQAVINAEIANAEAFDQDLNALYFATSAQSDALVQAEIRRISRERVAEGKFAVGVFFWSDLILELVKNSRELKVHYPDLALPEERENLRSRTESQLSLLDMTYYGLYVEEYMDLLFGEFGMGSDPHEFEHLLSAVGSAAVGLADLNFAKELASVCEELSVLVMGRISERLPQGDGWKTPRELALKIARLVRSQEYGQTGSDAAIYALGKLLGAWSVNIVEQSTLPSEAWERLNTYFNAIQPTESIRDSFNTILNKHKKKIRTKSTDLSTPSDLYFLIRKLTVMRRISSEV